MNIVPDEDLWDMCHDCGPFSQCTRCKAPDLPREEFPCMSCGLDLWNENVDEMFCITCPQCGTVEAV